MYLLSSPEAAQESVSRKHFNLTQTREILSTVYHSFNKVQTDLAGCIQSMRLKVPVMTNKPQIALALSFSYCHSCFQCVQISLIKT